jgi:hypothetical protein
VDLTGSIVNMTIGRFFIGTLDNLSVSIVKQLLASAGHECRHFRRYSLFWKPVDWRVLSRSLSAILYPLYAPHPHSNSVSGNHGFCDRAERANQSAAKSTG